MNKTEKLICLVLGAVLAWYLFTQSGKRAGAAADAAAATNEVAAAETPAATNEVAAVAEPAVTNGIAAVAAAEAAAEPELHDTFVSISNDQEVVTFAANEAGVAIKSVTLLGYTQKAGPASDGNPPVTLDFGNRYRALRLGVDAFATAGAEFRADTPTSVVYRTASMTRRFTLLGGYRIGLEEEFRRAEGNLSFKDHFLTLGTMRMGDSKNDLLSIDSWAKDAGKGKPGVIHHCEGSSPFKPYLVGGLSGGCGGSKSAEGMPASADGKFPGAQEWLAVKNRFFVIALAACDQENRGFVATVERDTAKPNYAPKSVAAAISFDEAPAKRTAVFYAGPKKQSLLWDLGMKDVMEFGMWRWLCYPLVWVLNLFHSWIPNFGVAIILLTIAVRLLFWPLTRKSTEGMKRMQELQPLMKEIQAKYKDNPQRLQQETWALYRDKKVNPMSACLPMFIQIPVFIALFNVLRSAVELRYAPFLWIADLSEPEALFASWFPFGGLNVLPILMAVSTGLQSAFTPSTGDKQQQKMMMVFMPVMMLFMFYSFPSALSLYWFLSNLFSIVQMWLIRRETARKAAVVTPEVIDPPAPTRQQRRHS